MDDLELDFNDVDFLPGVDLYLWLRLVLGVLVALGVCAAVTAVALGGSWL